MKLILIVYQTHGNEPIGKDSIDILKKDYPAIYQYCDFVQGNPLAAERNVRFIDSDLNRVAPGIIISPHYEEKRAAELTDSFKEYEYVIDIHETKSSDDTMIIIPSNGKDRLNAIQYCPIEKVIIWTSSNPETSNPLITFAPKGFEIEIGTKTSYFEKIEEVTHILVSTIENIQQSKTTVNQKIYYKVEGRIQPSDIQENTLLENFKKYQSPNNEEFYPLLFGSFDGKLGYKMYKIHINL